LSSDAPDRERVLPRRGPRRLRPAKPPRSLLWRRSAQAVVVLLATVGMLLPWVGADAGSYTTIDGSGSSWASVALDQWAKDVQPQGLTVNYNPDGSAQGRSDWIQGSLIDYAGSDPPFRSGHDKLAGTGAEHSPWGFSYVPDTAGGTAFMYHLTVGGHQVRNLRLSPKVIMEIFTGAITNWDDPQITKIYGAQLPSEPITPVVRADGSGATFFFTLWMSTLFPSQWNKFCEKVHPGITLPCGNTEFYPTSHFGNSKAENGSLASANYVTASYGEGSIDYDEYAYALNAHYPVVQVLNPDNYFVGPTASNVAVALTKAQINHDPHSQNYLQQNLSNVYTFRDPRSYPLSSYSYLIVPRDSGKEPPFFNGSSGAGRSLSAYINFFLCAGQRQSKDLGYSPLPLNLVKGGLAQNAHIPGHGSIANVNSFHSCPNPTFTNGKLTVLLDAPYPSKCQHLGAPLHCVVKNGKAVQAGGGGAGGSGGGGSSGAGGGAGGSSGGSGGGGGGSSGTSGGNSNLAAGTGGGTGSTTGAASVTGSVVNLASNGTDRALLALITALAVVLAVAAPPAVGSWLRRRKRRAGA
jgi:ABC-type phosphate transport system substrate-binding protein